MGQALADLPNPVETPRASEVSADDLLAQMAGDEIDRLLAEANVELAEQETESTPTPPPPAPSPVQPVAPAPQAAMPDEGFMAQVAEEAVAAPARFSRRAASREEPPSPAPAPAGGDVALDAQLDDLFAQLTGGDAPAAQIPPSPASPGAGEVVEVPTPPAIVGDIALASATSLSVASPAATPVVTQAVGSEAIVSALPSPSLLRASASAATSAAAGLATPAASFASVEVAAPPPAEPIAADSADSDEATDSEEMLGLLADDEALPIYLRPLAWINAPLRACSQGVREFIGKAAILTLVNAVALLLYVVIFRRH